MSSIRQSEVLFVIFMESLEDYAPYTLQLRI